MNADREATMRAALVENAEALATALAHWRQYAESFEGRDLDTYPGPEGTFFRATKKIYDDALPLTRIDVALNAGGEDEAINALEISARLRSAHDRFAVLEGVSNDDLVVILDAADCIEAAQPAQAAPAHGTGD